MHRSNPLSEHKDSSIAFWLVAHVQQLDTHSTWSARWYSRRDDGSTETSNWLFRDYTCDVSVLHELVKRGLVVNAQKEAGKTIQDEPWVELEETIEACKSLISIPLDEDAREHNQTYREPDSSLWFEVVVESFTDESVVFSLSTWGYKYRIQNLTLPKQLYYIFADRLDAKVRFVREWFSLESVVRQLEAVMHQGSLLPAIAVDLGHELALLRTPNDQQVQASCRSVFPLLERAMREHVESRVTGRRAGTLDDLIRRFESESLLSQDTIELLRFAMKPKRDYVEHGRTMPQHIARLVLVTLLEVLSRMGDVEI